MPFANGAKNIWVNIEHKFNRTLVVKEQPVQEYLTASSGILGQIILEI